jgi:hypothetical protein
LWNALSGFACSRDLGALDFGDAHVFGEEMRSHQRQAAHAVVLDAAGVDCGDRGAVAVADEQAAAEADCVEHARQHVAGFLVHEGDRARQLRRRRVAVAGARIGEHADAGRRRELVGEAPPHRDRAEPLVQQDERGGLIWPRSDHAVFEPHVGELDEACIGEIHDPAPTVQLSTMRASFAKLASTVSSAVSSSASARA